MALVYPKGTCKVVPFYFRGDDPFKEQEFLRAEYSKNMKALLAKERELNETQKEFNQLQEEMQFCDVYAAKLAKNLGEGSQATTEHIKLLDEISALEKEQNNLIEQVKSAKSWTNPIELERLMREDAVLIPGIDQRMRDLEEINQGIEEMEGEIADIVSSDDYKIAVSSELEARVALQCRNRLKQELSILRNGINEAPSGENGKRTTMANEMTRANDPIMPLISEKTDIQLEQEEAQLKKTLAAMHYRAAMKSSIRVIEALNEILKRFDKGVFDIEELKQRCGLGENEDEEGKQNADSRPGSTNQHGVPVSKRRKNNSKMQISTPNVPRKGRSALK